jgi:hypothetical protein
MLRSGASLRHTQQFLTYSPPSRIALLARNDLLRQPSALPLSPSSPFSTNNTRHNKQANSSPKKPNNNDHPSTKSNPEIPSFSFEGLGISQNMKRVIIGIICIFGTMETYTYYRWISNWYYGEGADKEAEGAVER